MAFSSRTKSRLRIWLGGGVSLLALWLAFRNVEWGELTRALARVRPGWIALGILCTQLELTLAAWRWQVLLRPIGRYRLGADCFPLFMVGYAANQIFPARPGEIIRSFLFGRKFAVSKAAVLGTAVVEKLVDVVALVLLLGLALVFIDVPLEIRLLGGLCGVVSIVAWGILWLVCRREALSNWLLRGLRWTPPAIHRWLEQSLRNSIVGMGAIHDLATAFSALALSAAVWGAGILVTQAYLMAFGLHLPWHAPVFVLVVVNLGMLIPSSPAAVGVAHLLYVVSLTVFGVDKATALAVGLVLHAISFVQVVVVGLLCFGHENLQVKDIDDQG